jgi:hypothetical protein
MSDFPADTGGFRRVTPQAPQASDDGGFKRVTSAPAAPSPSAPERLWNTVSQMVQAPSRFAQGVSEGAAGQGVPAGRASQFEGGPARFAGRALGTGGRSVAESLWDMVKAPGKMATGEMQPGPEAEAAARGIAMSTAGGGFRPGSRPMPSPWREGMEAGGTRTLQEANQGLAPQAGRLGLGGAPRVLPPDPRPDMMPPGPTSTMTRPEASPPPTRPGEPPPGLSVTKPIETSTLGDAIATNNSGAVDKYITSRYRSAVKPSKAETRSAPDLAQQDQRILTTVDQIIANRGSLKLTDASGAETTGRTPSSLRQFSEAVDQTKKSLFQKYDTMARSAGDVGVQVDLAPVISELRSIGTRPEVVDLHPEMAPQIETLARNFEARGFYTPSAAQDAIENINKMLSAFYKNPTEQTVSRATLLAPIARTLRGQLDAAIEGATGPGYQALRQQYGALSSVEKDIAKAVQRETNKLPGGLAGTFADIGASEEAIRGIFTLNPAALARAGGIKAAQQAVKYINNPNRAIERLFARRAAPPPGPPSNLAAPAFRGAQLAMGMDMDMAQQRPGSLSGGLPQPKRDPDQPIRHSIGGM